MKFYIPEFNLPKLEKLVKRLSKKTAIHFEVFDDTRRQTALVLDGVKYPYTEIEVELDLDYKVGDYELIAQLEHTPKGNVIRKINPDAEIPNQYRNTNCYCDHCHTNRERKNTFLLVDKNGDYKQVGKSCLNDFTGYNSESVAEAAASLYRIYNYAQMQNYDEDPEFLEFLRDNYDNYSDTKDLANRMYQLLKDKGYNKENPFHDLDDYKYKPELENEVEELLNVVNTDWYDDNNDYCHNAKVVAQLDYITNRQWKILMSYLYSAMKYLQKQKQRELQNNADSNIYLGEVGDKIAFTIQSVKVLFSNYMSVGYRNTVETFTYKFITENGNVVLWATSKEITDDYVGCKVTGTIKALKEYKGEKQTIITRAKIDETGLQDRINQRKEQQRLEYERKAAEEKQKRSEESKKNDWIADYCEKHNLEPYWLEDNWAKGEEAWNEYNKKGLFNPEPVEDDILDDDGFGESYSTLDAWKDLKDIE